MIAFALISLIHVQIQEPGVGQVLQQHLSFSQNLLNFIITKYLKQEINDDLSVFCMKQSSPCEIYQCHMIKR